MKGQVLGFDGTTGAISGEDGARYSFAADAWKGERPPQSRDAVDFVVTDGAAHDVYLVQSALGATIGSLGANAREKLGGAGAAPGAAGVRTFVAERPQVILAGVALLASLLLTFVSGAAALEPGSTSVSAVGFPGLMNRVVSGVAQVASFMGATPAGDAYGGLQFAAMLSYLLYLIPVLAAFAIFRDVTGKRMRVLELVLGALCVGSLLIYFIAMSAIRTPLGAVADMAMAQVAFGFGGYVLVLCGVLLLLTGLGRIKQTPGL